MKLALHILPVLLLLFLTVGCSSKLSRREARNQIDAMMKPHPIGPKNFMTPAGPHSVPGFDLPSADKDQSSYFTLDKHKEYGGLTLTHPETKSPDSEEYLLRSLRDLGYLTITEEGPKTISSYAVPLHYANSRTVSITSKFGSIIKTGYSQDYSSGFSCYPAPDFHQCDLPPLLEMDSNYDITGIVQDETHAKVNILIPWKLTKFGLELKSSAASVAKNEDKFGIESNYMLYPSLYSWAHFLNSHANSGSSPAAILFQKFDDGWRIVDAEGKSEKDFKKE